MSDVAIATLVSTLVASLVGWLTQRSSSKSSEVIASTTTRGEIEKDAFQRAETFYKNALDRQDKEIQEQAAEIASLKERVTTLEAKEAALESEVAYYRRAGKRMARALFEIRRAIAGGHVPLALDPAAVEDSLNFLEGDDQ